MTSDAPAVNSRARAGHRLPRLHSCKVDEVVNYVGAMRYGLTRLSKPPVSVRLVREIHYDAYIHLFDEPAPTPQEAAT